MVTSKGQLTKRRFLNTKCFSNGRLSGKIPYQGQVKLARVRGPLICFENLYALYMHALYECSSAVKTSISKKIVNVLE